VEEQGDWGRKVVGGCASALNETFARVPRGDDEMFEWEVATNDAIAVHPESFEFWITCS